MILVEHAIVNIQVLFFMYLISLSNNKENKRSLYNARGIIFAFEKKENLSTVVESL